MLELILVAAIVIYSLRQIRLRKEPRLPAVLAAVYTAALVILMLFLFLGAPLERNLSRDSIMDAGVVATLTMMCAGAVSGCAALVCLLRKTQGWRAAFILQT